MNKSYVIRATKEDGSSRNGFVWPLEVGAVVTCPDWKASEKCGNGLHGWLNGAGYPVCTDLGTKDTDKWFVLEVDTDSIIDLDGKVKFPSAKIVLVGTRDEATTWVWKNVPGANRINWLTASGGDFSTLTGGYRSTLTGGYRSTLTGGDGSTLTGGYGSTLTGGDFSTLTGGNFSTLTCGYRSTLTGGYDSTLTGGDGSTLTGGDGSTLTGGYGSTLTGGYRSTLTGGEYSTLNFTYFKNGFHRFKTFYVGEDGVEPNVAYEYDVEKEVIIKVEKSQ